MVQLRTSNELGWYKVFNLNSAENKIQVAPKISANKFPFNSSIAFHTTRIVSAPNNDGKNLTQKTEFPKKYMILEIQDVKGGTDKYPQAKWCAWSR